MYDSCSYEVGLFLVCSSRPHFRNFLDHQSFKPHHHDKMADDSGVRHCHLTVFCVAGEAAAAGDKHGRETKQEGDGAAPGRRASNAPARGTRLSQD